MKIKVNQEQTKKCHLKKLNCDEQTAMGGPKFHCSILMSLLKGM